MPNSGLRKYTLNGGLLMLPPPPLAERGLSVSALINSFCLAVCLSAGIGGNRVLSAALKRLGAAKAASNAIANVFLISSSLKVTGWPPGSGRALSRQFSILAASASLQRWASRDNLEALASRASRREAGHSHRQSAS